MCLFSFAVSEFGQLAIHEAENVANALLLDTRVSPGTEASRRRGDVLDGPNQQALLIGVAASTVHYCYSVVLP